MSELTTSWFTPDGQDPNKAQRSYLLRPLSRPELEQVLEVEGDHITIPIRNTSHALRMALSEWKGIHGKDGQLLPCLPQHHAEIQLSDRMQLRNQIFTMAMLAEAEAKNS